MGCCSRPPTAWPRPSRFIAALAIHEKSYGPGHAEVAIDLNNLAQLLKATNRMAEAEPLFRRALAILKKSYGPIHPEVGIDLNNLAQLLQATNRMAEAEPLLRRALAIAEKSYGPDHPDVARVLNNLAQLLQATNRMAEAEPLMARAFRIISRFQRSTGHEHPHLRLAMVNYRALLSRLKLSEPEIEARIKAANEGTDRLSPIVPEVERLLGPARSVADLLAALDRQYREQSKPAVYFLKLNEEIAPHLDELLKPKSDGLNALGVTAFRRGAHADAVGFYEAAIELMAQEPESASAKLTTRMNHAAALCELGAVEQARDELSKLLPALEKLPATESLLKGRARYHLTLCQWRVGDRTAAQRSAQESLTAYNSAPKANPIAPAVRRNSEDLLAKLKAGEPAPPRAAIDAPAALESARARYRAREALTKLPLAERAAPLLDQILGPATPTKDVFEALDKQYHDQHKPPIWFLPLEDPIAPHLDQLLGPTKSVQEVLAALDRQYREEGKPAIWFLPLNEPITPHLDELLGKPSK